MKTILREQSAVERTRHAGDQTRPEPGALPRPNPLVESRQRSEYVVEVIVEEVVQEEPELGRRSEAEAGALCVHGV